MAWAVRQKAGSPMGKIILLMIANRADEDGRCFPSQQRLALDCECSIRIVRKWLSVFEQAGLLRRCERRRSDGRKTSDETFLAMDGTFDIEGSNQPANFAACSSAAPDAACDPERRLDQAEPDSGETSAAPGADFTGTRCRLTYHRTYQDSVGSAREAIDEFDRVFWPAYPHKVGKGQARSAWRAARKRADLETIMQGLSRYVASKPERQAWCHPTTWLNGERWLDEPGRDPMQGIAARQERPSAQRRVWDEIDRQLGDDAAPRHHHEIDGSLSASTDRKVNR